jgi:phosphoribosyl 1,2-cyclic phosphodiesterase
VALSRAMKIRFWGTRGSLPAPLAAADVRGKLRQALLAASGKRFDAAAEADAFIDQLPFAVAGTFGGNSSCVEIATGGPEHVLCDMGSGARAFGNRMLATYGPARGQVYNLFLSHVHWDHIMGFPFFTPAYIPGNIVRIHGCHAVMREAFERQQSDPCFPVNFRVLGARIEFVELKPGQRYDIAGLSVLPILQNHAGDSYGYRFERDGKSLVYSTDCEHKFETLDANYPFVGFFRDADLLIFDSMYSLADAISVKEDWGHSSNMVAVELAQMAGVKHLVMYHHEPAYDDAMIASILDETRRYEEISRSGAPLKVTSAYDGLEIEL